MWQTSTFATNPGTVTWQSSTQPFDGYILLILAIPVNYSKVQIQGLNAHSIAQRTKVKIINGQIDGSVLALYTASIDPPNTLYSPFWYDSGDNLVFAPTTIGTPGIGLFQITGSPTVLSVPTLTPPAQSAIVPNPSVNPTTMIANGPFEENSNTTLGGAINSSNKVFTLSRVPSYLMFYRNRQKLLVGTDYTLSGLTVTFSSAATAPQQGDTLEAVYWT